MKVVLALGLIFAGRVLAWGMPAAPGEGSYAGEPLIQVDFNHLIPRSYPLITTRFNSLQPTTYPVIHPGVARVPITENLVHPLAQPLLRSN